MNLSPLFFEQPLLRIVHCRSFRFVHPPPASHVIRRECRELLRFFSFCEARIKTSSPHALLSRSAFGVTSQHGTKSNNRSIRELLRSEFQPSPLPCGSLACILNHEHPNDEQRRDQAGSVERGRYVIAFVGSLMDGSKNSVPLLAGFFRSARTSAEEGRVGYSIHCVAAWSYSS